MPRIPTHFHTNKLKPQKGRTGVLKSECRKQNIDVLKDIPKTLFIVFYMFIVYREVTSVGVSSLGGSNYKVKH